MNRRFVIFLALFNLFALKCFNQTVGDDNNLRSIITRDAQVEITIPYTNRANIDSLTRYVSILSVDNKIVHISLSPITIEWFISQKFDYQVVTREVAKGIITSPSLTQAMAWDSYPTYSQYDSIMQSFAKLYPALCHLDTIGTSVKGKLVLALKISNNASIDEDEPKVFYTSTIHGDETGGYILMLHLIDYLLKNYTVSSRVKNLVDNLEIWINPLANPDGAYKSGNIISSTYSTRSNANGYDLNRNFPDPKTPYTSSNIQQKETLEMINFMRKHKFVISANFHAGKEVVNYPWDKWASLHADNDWFVSISRSYADTVHAHSIPGYMTFKDNGVTNGFAWYSVYGGRQDYVTYELQGREVTIELDNNYITPATQLNSLWESNWRSLLGYLENALYGIHGHVINSISNIPIQANVVIKGHDIDNSNIYSDPLTGKFTRLLAPGSWNLSFSAVGYRDTTLNNLIVYPGEKTEITVRMEPSKNESVILYPNPAISDVIAVLPQEIFGVVNIRIINQSGIVISDYMTSVLPKVPIVINVGNLSSGLYTIVFKSSSTGISSYARLIVDK
jgi:hypothetical protein